GGGGGGVRSPVPPKRASGEPPPDGAQPHRAMPSRASWSPPPSRPPAPGPAATRLLLHELTAPLIQRPERLLSGDSCADLVVVPRVLGLGGLLHLDEIRRMNLAAVDTNRPLAEERVVRRHLFHLGDDLGAVVALERLDGLQVV